MVKLGPTHLDKARAQRILEAGKTRLITDDELDYYLNAEFEEDKELVEISSVALGKIMKTPILDDGKSEDKNADAVRAMATALKGVALSWSRKQFVLDKEALEKVARGEGLPGQQNQVG